MNEEIEDLLQTGVVAYTQGQFEKARKLYMRALKEARKIEDNRYIAMSLYNIGLIHENKAEFDTAMEYYHESLETCEELEDKTVGASCLVNIGQIQHIWGQSEKALESFQEALQILEKEGRIFATEMGAVLNAIGLVYMSLGNFSDAAQYFQQSLDRRRESNDLAGASVSLNNLGMIHLYQGRYEEARMKFQEALDTYDLLECVLPWGIPYNNLGEIARIRGNYADAMKNYEHALGIYKEIGDKKNIAVALNNIGLLFLNWGNFKEALNYYQKALQTWEETGILQSKATTLTNIGDVYKSWSKYEEALGYYQDALDICEEIGAIKEEGVILNCIGMVYVSKGEYKEGVEYFTRSLELSTKTGDIEAKGFAYNNLGLVSQSTGNYADAIMYYNQALEVLGESGNAQAKFIAENNIGEVYFSWGKFNDALEYFNSSLENIEALGNKKDMSVPLNNIGRVYLTLSKFDDALVYYLRALEISEGIGNRRDQSVSLNNIGTVYRMWGKIDAAIQYYDQSLTIQQEIGDPHQAGVSLNNIGEGQFLLGNYEIALDYFNRALEVFQEMDDPKATSIALNNIGLVQQMQGNFKGAIENYNMTLKIAREIGDRHNEGLAINNIGLVYQVWEKHDEALEYLKRACEINIELGDLNRKSIALTNIGFSYWYKKQYKEALDHFIEAVDIQEGLIGTIKSEDVRISYRTTQLGPYEAITEMLLDWYQKDQDEAHLREGLKFLELSKAREIIDKLESGRVKIETCPELHKLLRLEQELLYEISQLQSVVESEVRQGKARSITMEELDDKGTKLKKVRKQLMEKCKDPGLTRVTKEYNPIPDLEELFKQDELIVWEFVYFPNWFEYKERFKIIAWEKGRISVFKSNKFEGTHLETLNREFHEYFGQGTQKGARIALEKLIQLQKELTLLLPEELLQTIENKKRLLLIPHGILHIFPWEIIEKLGLKLPIIRSYSLGLLRSCIKRECPTRNILLITNPNFNIEHLNLPGADLEAQSIKSLLKGLKLKYKLLAHEQAVEKAFVDLINQEFGVIHFAGHGVYELTQNDPWTSGLLFYRQDGYDIRTVTELIEQGFKGTPLCVLSACETGRAEVSRGGDELIGLIRGLTLAGVTTIIATHWLLDDNVAPHFMQKFYENFLRGEDVSVSLFKARKQIYEKFEHPIDWGVYTIYGNPFKRNAN